MLNKSKMSCADLCCIGCGCGGKRGVGENPCPARVPMLWVGRRGGLPHTFHATPGGCLAVESPHTHNTTFNNKNIRN